MEPRSVFVTLRLLSVVSTKRPSERLDDKIAMELSGLSARRDECMSLYANCYKLFLLRFRSLSIS